MYRMSKTNLHIHTMPEIRGNKRPGCAVPGEQPRMMEGANTLMEPVMPFIPCVTLGKILNH